METEKTPAKIEEEICVILGVLIEQEQERKNNGKKYYGNVEVKGGGLSYFNEQHKTTLHTQQSDDYLYLRAEDPKLKGTYVPIKRILIKKLIDDALRNGRAEAGFDVQNVEVDRRQSAPEDRFMEYQTYQQDVESYTGRINLHLNVEPNFAQDLVVREAALWSQGLSPSLEFIVGAEGTAAWR